MKIFVIGNSASGKSRLSRSLRHRYDINVFHVDSYQFDSHLNMRPYHETLKALAEVQKNSSWIIDGYGPLDDLQSRLRSADFIIHLDWPLWHNVWWGTKRFFYVFWRPRPELPPGHNEIQWEHIKKFYKGLWKVHRLMRPELLKILSRPELVTKVVHIRTGPAYREMLKNGVLRLTESQK